jgi:hypothetical protein
MFKKIVFKTGYTGYFTSDDDPGGIENATHNTFPKLTWFFKNLFCFKMKFESMMALLPIILFVTTDVYEKVKIRRLKSIRQT